MTSTSAHLARCLPDGGDLIDAIGELATTDYISRARASTATPRPPTSTTATSRPVGTTWSGGHRPRDFGRRGPPGRARALARRRGREPPRIRPTPAAARSARGPHDRDRLALNLRKSDARTVHDSSDDDVELPRARLDPSSST